MIAEHHIDLNEFRSGASRVYAGRERGKLARSKAGLDRLDQSSVTIVVRVPENTLSVNSSFFLGMFGPSVRALGPDGFVVRYRFEGKGIEEVIEDGIREALRTDSPL